MATLRQACLTLRRIVKESPGCFTPLIYIHGALFTTWVALFIGTDRAGFGAPRGRPSPGRCRGRGSGGCDDCGRDDDRVGGGEKRLSAAGNSPPGVPRDSAVRHDDVHRVHHGCARAETPRGGAQAADAARLREHYGSTSRAPAGRVAARPARVLWHRVRISRGGNRLRPRVTAAYPPRVCVGGTLLVASVPLRLAISGTATWIAIAQALTR